ncbi:MAG: response regulator [Bacteroidota bacterium]
MKKKILIVDDAKLWASHIWGKLEELGIDYQWVLNGAYAVKRVARNIKYDAIIMDMKMPVMNGREATRKLRKMGYTKPIIGHTSLYHLEEDNELAENSGVDTYLPKSIDLDPLVEVLRRFKLLDNQ